MLVTAVRNGTTATQNQGGVGLPVTRIETISDGFIDYSKVRHLDVHPQDIDLYRLRIGDVLLSHINSIKHIGKVARYGGEYPLIHGMNLIRIIFDEQRLDPLFGYYILSSPRAKHYFERRAKKAINQASLNRKDIGAFPVYLPPLPEQRKIAAILSSVDDAIEKTQAVIGQVQIVKRGLMQELLTRGLPRRHTQVQADRDREETGETGRDEPDRWRPAHLGDLARVNPEQLGSRTDPDHLLEYLDITAIERPGVFGSSRTFRFSEAPSRARRLAREGDILVSTVRPYLRNFARVREAPDNLVVSTGYAVIRRKTGWMAASSISTFCRLDSSSF